MTKLFYATFVEIPEDCRTKEIPDLYSLVYPRKEEHHRDFGIVTNDFEEKMLALLQGRPQKRILEDRLSREVVKAILSYNQNGFPNWLRIQGKDARYTYTGSAVFPGILDNIIQTRLQELMRDGLLEGVFHGICSSCYWAFESEVIYYHERVPDSEGKPAINTTVAFARNQPLRNALEDMMKPFIYEKPLYKHTDKSYFNPLEILKRR